MKGPNRKRALGPPDYHPCAVPPGKPSSVTKGLCVSPALVGTRALFQLTGV